MSTTNPNANLPEIKSVVSFNLEAIFLVAPAITSLDLRQHLVELSYYEDIFNNTISGQLVLSDAVGILNFASLNGNEYLKLVFSKGYESKQTINRTFRIFSITNRIVDVSNATENYVIEFCSDELFLSEQYRLSKSYKSVKISDIISDIMNNYLKVKKKVDLENTSGLYDFVLPNKKLFETINWLTTYALPDSKNPGADMIFFENANGYYLRSLQTLFKQSAKLTLYFNPKNLNQNLNQTDFFNVIKLEFLNYFDTLNGVTSGTFANRVITFDPLTRKKQSTDFNYKQYFGSSQKLNNSPIVNNTKNRHNKYIYDSPPQNLEAGVLRLSVSNSQQASNDKSGRIQQNPTEVKKDFFVEKWMPYRVGQIALSNYMRLRVTLPGCPSLTAGTTVYFYTFGIAPMNSKDGGRQEDFYVGGKYLVSSVRHIINSTSHITVAELIRDSTTHPFVDGSGTDAIWSRIVNGDQS